MHVGDVAVIHLQPKRIDPCCFEVISQIHLGDQQVASGGLKHLAIDAMTRKRCSLPKSIERWIEASTLGQIQPL
jgi:1,4-dihydroxy-2-naphthoyl-CoA hydrolase